MKSDNPYFRKRVGVLGSYERRARELPGLSTILKRNYLYFDQIAVITLPTEGPEYAGIVGDELSFLMDQGILRHIENPFDEFRNLYGLPGYKPGIPYDPEVQKCLITAMVMGALHTDEFVAFCIEHGITWGESCERTYEQMERLGETGQHLVRLDRLREPLAHAALLRGAVAALINVERLNALSIEGATTILNGPTRGNNTADLIQVALHNVPMLDERIGWQDIIDFKKDSDTRHFLDRLRLWIESQKDATCDLGLAAEQISYDLEEYRRHLRRAGGGEKVSIIETLIVGGANIIESVLKGKLASLAKAGVEIFQARRKLLEAEANAPSKELAFLSRAADTFAR